MFILSDTDSVVQFCLSSMLQYILPVAAPRTVPRSNSEQTLPNCKPALTSDKLILIHRKQYIMKCLIQPCITLFTAVLHNYSTEQVQNHRTNRFFNSKCNYFNEQNILISLKNKHNNQYAMGYQEVIICQIIYAADFI